MTATVQKSPAVAMLHAMGPLRTNPHNASVHTTPHLTAVSRFLGPGGCKVPLEKTWKRVPWAAAPYVLHRDLN